MLRTFILQNKEWFANSDHPFPQFGGMDSEIAELRTMTKVTRLRKQIECREEGAWMVVKDVPDETVPSGTRKVTAYGRTRRSVTRSVTSNAEFDNSFSDHGPLEPLVQHPGEEDDAKQTKPSTVEITEVFDEPIRTNIPDLIPQKPTPKKTSVVTLGKGNIVLIDPEGESNIKVTGISKGKVADVVSTLERTHDKKPKKVGFCKTEVHFAPDSGKINIVETDEKPPPTQVYRKKKRSRNIRSKTNSCLPKHYFGEVTDFCDDSNQSNESDREDSRIPLTITHNIEILPEVKKVFPTFEKTIKSESKDVKYRYSSPEKNDSDIEIDKFRIDEKDFFRKLKQPPFRDRFLKETESLSESLPNEVNHNMGHSSLESRYKKSLKFHDTEKILNGHASKYESSDKYFKDRFPDNSFESKDENEDYYNPEPVLKYTELFKIPCKNDNDYDSLPNISESTSISEKLQRDPIKTKQSNYGLVNKQKTSIEDKYDFVQNISRVPVDQDLKSNVSFLGSMSPKLKNLIKNSVEHEFQLRQKQILQKRNVEKNVEPLDEGDKVKTSINVTASTNKVDKEESGDPENLKLKSAKTVTHIKVEKGNDAKHEFQLKRDQITKHISDPIYDKKEFELKEMPYLLKEEPIPAPREKSLEKPKTVSPAKVPPKPKPRTIISNTPDKNHIGKVSSRHSVKSGSSSISRRMRSRENLSQTKEVERTHPRSSVSKEDIRQRKVSTTSCKAEGGVQRLAKSSIQAKKPVRGEPLRSFEKVSNGWVGHCVVPTKQDDKTSSKVTVTTKVYSSKTQMHQSPHHLTGVRKSTHSSTLKSNQSLKSDSVTRGTKQFSLSKEHLSSAKLVKEISPRRTTKTRTEVRTSRARTVPSKDCRRVRRDSNDSVVQADEEVRAYMFSSRPKVLINTKKFA